MSRIERIRQRIVASVVSSQEWGRVGSERLERGNVGMPGNMARRLMRQARLRRHEIVRRLLDPARTQTYAAQVPLSTVDAHGARPPIGLEEDAR